MFCSLGACFASSITTSCIVGGGTAAGAAIRYGKRYSKTQDAGPWLCGGMGPKQEALGVCVKETSSEWD